MLLFILSFCVSDRDKIIKIPTLKWHPYSSHISKFAIFPSFRPPGDPETGVRASSRPYFNPGMTVLKKTKGKRATKVTKVTGQALLRKFTRTVIDRQLM